MSDKRVRTFRPPPYPLRIKDRPLAIIEAQRATFCFQKGSYLAWRLRLCFVFLLVLGGLLLLFCRCFLFGLRGCRLLAGEPPEQGEFSPPTVKQHLAALRMLFDWLVTGHVLEVNPSPTPCAAPNTSSEKARRPS